MSNPSRPTPRPGIENLPPYVPGKSKAGSGSGPKVKLSANESPLGASPKAIEAYEAAAKALERYPDAHAAGLRAALADVNGLDAARIVIGAGSDEILHLLAEAYLEPGDEAVMTEYGFLMYPIATLAAGAQVVVAPDKDYRVDVDAVLGAVTEKTKIVWLANPNNPTGTYLGGEEVRRLHAGLPAHVLLVIDNAYAEYVTAGDFETGARLAEEADNAIMVRTFSKMGLAALRVGWAYGPQHIVDVLNRLRSPFNVSVPAQAAAEAAARDTGFTQKLRDHNARLRDRLVAGFQSNRIKVLPSQGNFVLALFGESEGFTAAGAFDYLADNGLIVREMGSYKLPGALRISIGTDADIDKVIGLLRAYEGSAS